MHDDFETGFENGHFRNFRTSVILILILDWVIRHTVVDHSSTSTYTLNFAEIGKNFCGRTNGRTDIEAGFIKSTRKLGKGYHDWKVSRTTLHHRFFSFYVSSVVILYGRMSVFNNLFVQLCSFAFCSDTGNF